MSKTQKKQIKTSILMILGMLCLIIGQSKVPDFIKNSALFLSLASFLFLIFCFVKSAKNQIIAAKGKTSINE